MGVICMVLSHSYNINFSDPFWLFSLFLLISLFNFPFTSYFLIFLSFYLFPFFLSCFFLSLFIFLSFIFSSLFLFIVFLLPLLFPQFPFLFPFLPCHVSFIVSVLSPPSFYGRYNNNSFSFSK